VRKSSSGTCKSEPTGRYADVISGSPRAVHGRFSRHNLVTEYVSWYVPKSPRTGNRVRNNIARRYVRSTSRTRLTTGRQKYRDKISPVTGGHTAFSGPMVYGLHRQQRNDQRPRRETCATRAIPLSKHWRARRFRFSRFHRQT